MRPFPARLGAIFLLLALIPSLVGAQPGGSATALYVNHPKPGYLVRLFNGQIVTHLSTDTVWMDGHGQLFQQEEGQKPRPVELPGKFQTPKPVAKANVPKPEPELSFPLISEIRNNGCLMQAFDQPLPAIKPGLFLVNENGLLGLIDSAGNWVIPPSMDSLGLLPGQPGLIGKAGDAWRFFEPNGKPASGWLTGLSYLQPPDEMGFLKVQYQGLWGYLGTHGRYRVVPRYEQLGPFCHDRAIVRLRGRWGLINRYDNFVIPLNYDSLWLAEPDIYLARRGSSITCLDQEGRPLLEDAEIMAPTTWGGLLYQRNGRLGHLASSTGRGLSPLWQTLEQLPGGYYLAGANRMYGIYGPEGQLILPALYEHILADKSRLLLFCKLLTSASAQ